MPLPCPVLLDSPVALSSAADRVGLHAEVSASAGAPRSRSTPARRRTARSRGEHQVARRSWKPVDHPLCNEQPAPVGERCLIRSPGWLPEVAARGQGKKKKSGLVMARELAHVRSAPTRQERFVDGRSLAGACTSRPKPSPWSSRPRDRSAGSGRRRPCSRLEESLLQRRLAVPFIQLHSGLSLRRGGAGRHPVSGDVCAAGAGRLTVAPLRATPSPWLLPIAMLALVPGPAGARPRTAARSDKPGAQQPA